MPSSSSVVTLRPSFDLSLRAVALACLALSGVFVARSAHADSSTDAALAQSYAADALYAVEDFGKAMGYVSQGMQLAVGGDGVNKTVNCPAGGSVLFTATAGDLPVYAVAFQQCALTKSVVLGGNLVKSTTSKTKVSASPKNNYVGTTTEDGLNQLQAISVSMPYGLLTLNGETTSHSVTKRDLVALTTDSTITYTIPTGDSVALVASHTFSERSSSYAINEGTQVSYEVKSMANAADVTTVSGMVSLSVYPYLLPQVGQVDLLNFQLIFDDTFSYDGTNVANTGNLTLVTPVNTAYKVKGSNGQVSVCIDLLNDGTNEACWGPFSAASMTQ